MDPIYLDHAASSFLRPEVREVMAPFLGTVGNPSSLHRWGRRASAALESARDQVAHALGVQPREVHFVRGGTESSNLAILGRAAAVRRCGRPVRVAVSAVEHRAVLDTLEGVRSLGGEGFVLPVDASCAPDAEVLAGILQMQPAVVSLMAVNNETGAVPPLSDVAARCREAGVVVHCDAVQAPGHIPLGPVLAASDLCSFSGHKMGGPVGAGLLVVQGGVEVDPVLFGGGHEGGLRPGTQDVGAAVGIAEALRLAVGSEPEEAPRLRALARQMEDGLRAGLPDVRVHGAGGPRSPHIVNIGIPGVDGSLLLQALDLEGVAASRGSACSSGGQRTSHVLEATLGTREAARTAPLRLSFGPDTAADDIATATARILAVVGRLRATVGVA